MPTTRPRVPGWHPDPEDPSLLRHWDGKRWGRERRPRPSWAPLKPGEGAAPAVAAGEDDGPGHRSGRRRWWLLAGAALAFGLFVVSLSAWLDTTPDVPPRSVADTAFTTRAEALCAKEIPRLREDRPEVREDTGTPAQFAARIDRAADGLAGVTAALRAVPVADADAAEVDRWLDDWDAYVAVGRRYADRVRAGEQDAADDVETESSRISTAIFVFARSNGMPSCTL